MEAGGATFPKIFSVVLWDNEGVSNFESGAKLSSLFGFPDALSSILLLAFDEGG